MSSLDFNSALSAATAPLILVSGVGLILLSLINRFNHALDRTRLLAMQKQAQGEQAAPALRIQLSVLYYRDHILKRAIGFLLSGIIGALLLILMSVSSVLLNQSFDTPCIIILLVSLLCLAISCALFFADVRLPLVAIDLELGLPCRRAFARRLIMRLARAAGLDPKPFLAAP